MNITTLIHEADKEFRAARDMAEAILSKAKRENRADLTIEESRLASEHLARAEDAKGKKAALMAILKEDGEADERAKQTYPTGARSANSRTASVSIGREERTYHRGNDPTGQNFMLDVIRGQMFGDPNCNMRLSRHMNEEQIERPGVMAYRANDSTAQFQGLTVPQYLTDMVAPAVANMKPFCDAATTHHDLPAAGMSANISKITTATLASLQSAENAALPSQAASDTLLTIPVQTAGGWVNVSRQAIDRGIGIDTVLMQDLFARYYTDMDNQMINQATTGALAVGVNTDVVTASFTPQVLYSKINGAVTGVRQALLGMAKPTHVTMHPRRWDWLAGQTTATWPLISNQTVNGPGSGLGVLTDTDYGAGVVGKLPNGLLVVSDANIPTNLTADAGTGEDAILVTAQQECHLWQDPNQPAFIRAEQPNASSLGVLLVVYGYYAYTFLRYTSAVGKLTGSAFAAPVF